MSKIKVICDGANCDSEEMVQLYQVHGGRGQPPTFIMHCQRCGGTVGVQNVKHGKASMVKQNPIEDGARIKIPKPAPDHLEVIREAFDPEKLHARLMGVVKLPDPINEEA